MFFVKKSQCAKNPFNGKLWLKYLVKFDEILFLQV